MTTRWLWRLLAEHTLEIAAAICTYIAARWLLELSTPKEDILTFWRWWPLDFELRWYRGLEYWHQLRGLRILEQV